MSRLVFVDSSALIALGNSRDEYENSRWDTEISEDQKSGKLDKLINQALHDTESGNITPL